MGLCQLLSIPIPVMHLCNRVNNHKVDPRTQETQHHRDSGLDFISWFLIILATESGLTVEFLSIRSDLASENTNFLNISSSPSKCLKVTLRDEMGE